MKKKGGKYTVIRATPSCITVEVLDRIEEMFNEGFKEEKLQRTFSRSRFLEALFFFFQAPNVAMFLLMNRANKVSGVFIGILTKDFLTDNIIATELAWRVRKPGTGGGKLLYQAFEQWASENGATRIVLGGEVGQNEERVKRFYQDRGFEITGFIATKTLKEL